MKTFYIVGDSHSYSGWPKIGIPDIKINYRWLGAKTMSYFCIKEIVPILQNSQPDDLLCLCYGEVDCRHHVHKFEPNYKTYIDNMVKRYFESVVELRNIYNNLKICIFNVVPPLEREKVDYIEDKGLGSDEDRKKYTIYTNEKLNEYCENLGFVFFDVYYDYSDKNGYLNPDLSDGDCHIGDPKFMIDFIEKIIKNYANKK